MGFKKQQICIFLLGITLFGFVNSSRITIPLRQSNTQQLYATVKYGYDQCQIDLIPSLGSCTTLISEKIPSSGHCGSQYVGDNHTVTGKNFIAPFQLGETEAALFFTIPNNTSPNNGSQILCLGLDAQNDTFNALTELVQEKFITSKVLYFYSQNINSFDYDNGSYGTLSIGEPISEFSNGKYIPLKKDTAFSFIQAIVKPSLKTLGQEIEIPNVVYIDTTSPYASIPMASLDALLQLFITRGVKVQVVKRNYQVFTYLDTIKNLDSLHFTLIADDQAQTNFNVSLSPYSYTQKQDDGSYLLLIQSYSFDSFTLGSTILESQNFGFDLENQRILIAQKRESSIHNFRGAQIKL